MGNDRRARDILGELTTRRSLGDRLLDRIGRRAWNRPNVAVSRRLFEKFNISDPWDPNRQQEKPAPIGLGPVSLRLGPERRQPAPHLKPKAPKKKKASGPRLPNVPSSSQSSGGPRFPPGFKPPVGVPMAKNRQNERSIKPAKRPKTELGQEFGGPRSRKLVGALPVRPEVAARMKAEAAAAAEGKPAPGPVTLPKPTRPKQRLAQQRPRKPRVMSHNPNLVPPEGEAPISRRPPLPPRPSKKRRGRFNMQSTKATTAPVVTELPEPVVEAVSPAPEPAPPPAPPKPPSPPVTAGGLDDLFGFAAQEGRMRLGRRKTANTDENTD